MGLTHSLICDDCDISIYLGKRPPQYENTSDKCVRLCHAFERDHQPCDVSIRDEDAAGRWKLENVDDTGRPIGYQYNVRDEVTELHIRHDIDDGDLSPKKWERGRSVDEA